MFNEKVITYFENSFLAPLLKDEQITDISFNGRDIYYLHNELGRKKSDIKTTYSQIRDFLRQLANYCENQFSFSSPLLDVSFGKYRLNATFQNIGRNVNDHCFTFSIRIASSTPKITDDSGFLTPELIEFFKVMLANKVSIVIGGETGSGKTEFQKYLISKMPSNCRVIVIDNVLELDMERENMDLDLNVWQSDDRNSFTDIQHLVRNALRSNPDWLIVAESRGSEMLEVLNSVMTGHPIITTIHAKSAETMPYRMTRMIMMNDKKMEYNDVLKDIFSHIRIYIFLKRKIAQDGHVSRFIQQIVEFKGPLVKTIYRYNNGNPIYGKISVNLKNELDEETVSSLFKDTFMRKEK